MNQRPSIPPEIKVLSLILMVWKTWRKGHGGDVGVCSRAWKGGGSGGVGVQRNRAMNGIVGTVDPVFDLKQKKNSREFVVKGRTMQEIQQMCDKGEKNK